MEFQFYLTMETVEKVRTMCRPVFDNADVKKPTDRELALENNMFSFYNMIQGNRPGVFQNVHLDSVKKAADGFQDGKRHYYLSCASHKTEYLYLAYLYIQDIFWDNLLTYVKYQRSRPSAHEYKNILILNSLGRYVLNLSSELAQFLSVVEPRLKGSTNTTFRKLLTTLSLTHCSKDQQSVIHAMFANSAANAEQHYFNGRDQALPHRAGIPILSAFLEKYSEGRPRLMNYFSGAPRVR